MTKHKSKKKVKDMNELYATGRPVLSGMDFHVPQVTPDGYQAFERKMKLKTTIATWNVRTMLQIGKLDNIKQEMKRMKINILGIRKVRWQSAGKITSGTFEIFYSGGTEYERGLAIYWPKHGKNMQSI